MEIYKVKSKDNNEYVVIEINIIPGKRINAYDSEQDQEVISEVFSGSVSDCYAYIMLKENNYFI